jgi:chitinase
MRFISLLFLASTVLGFTERNLAPYFYTWGLGNPVYQVSSLMDANRKTGLKAATLAFLIGDRWTIDTIKGMRNDIQQFQALGNRVILSLGGASGPYIEETYQGSQLISIVDDVLQTTGIRDLDFE